MERIHCYKVQISITGKYVVWLCFAFCEPRTVLVFESMKSWFLPSFHILNIKSHIKKETFLSTFNYHVLLLWLRWSNYTQPLTFFLQSPLHYLTQPMNFLRIFFECLPSSQYYWSYTVSAIVSISEP